MLPIHRTVCIFCSSKYCFVSLAANTEAHSPWDSISPFVAMLPNQKSMPGWLLRPDIFHNWHLGAGKYFISSSLVVLQQFELLFPGGGVDARFAAMTSRWRDFCRSKKDTRFETCFLCSWGADVNKNVECVIGVLVYYSFCCSVVATEERPYLTKLGRDTLGFKTSLDWPEGGWQKGSTTTLLLDSWRLMVLITFWL